MATALEVGSGQDQIFLQIGSTYAVDWEPNVIIWYVDGIERLRYTDTTRIVKKPMYLIANLSVGGDLPGAPDTSTPFPSYYEIDYIRVWKRAITGG